MIVSKIGDVKVAILGDSVSRRYTKACVCIEGNVVHVKGFQLNSNGMLEDIELFFDIRNAVIEWTM